MREVELGEAELESWELYGEIVDGGLDTSAVGAAAVSWEVK